MGGLHRTPCAIQAFLAGAGRGCCERLLVLALIKEIRIMVSVNPVILCGGSGTRLWPLSRAGFPKQFLCLTGKESLFQQAALRLEMLGSEQVKVSGPLIVSGEDHRFLSSEQLREVGIEPVQALLEPVGRNTAPALTLAALAAVEGG